MKLRRCLALVGCGIVIAVVAAPLRAGATTASGCRPSITAVDPPIVAPGDEVTVSGSGFACDADAGGSPTVTVGGESQTVVAAGGDHTLQFRAGGATGAVQVSIQHTKCRHCPVPSPSNDDQVLLLKPTVSSDTRSVPEGGEFTVEGRGLSFAGFVQRLTATACGEALGVRAVDDAGLRLVAPNTFCRGPISLEFTVFTDRERDATTGYATGAGRLETAPAMRALSTAHAAPDQVVVVSGTGFGRSGAALLNGDPVASAWFDRSVSVTVQPQSLSGDLTLVRDDGRRLDAGHLRVDSATASLSADRAQAGDTVTISGGGFGSAGVVTLGQTRLPVSRWSATQIAVTIPGGATTGDLLVTPRENSPSPPPSTLGITVLGVDGITPSHGAPGARVEITGHGLGSTRPTLTLGTITVTPITWDDHHVVFAVPAGLRGATSVTLQIPGAASAPVIPFTVDPTTSAAPAVAARSDGGDHRTSSTGAGHVGATEGPAPRHAAASSSAPVAVVVSSAQPVARPGHDVSFTVRLTSNGRPLAGAPVDLLLVSVPAGDATVTPSTALSDVQGEVAGIMHLSAAPGDHTLLARSGSSSDEITVVARGGHAGAVSSISDAVAAAGLDGTRKTIVIVLAACLPLFLSGFGINLATGRGAAREPGSVRGTRCRRTRAGLIPCIASTLQFGLAMSVCIAARLVPHRRRA